MLKSNTGNFDFADFDEEYMRLNSLDKKSINEKPNIHNSNLRRGSDGRSEFRVPDNKSDFAFDDDPQPFNGFNDEDDDSDEDFFDFEREENKVNAKK